MDEPDIIDLHYLLQYSDGDREAIRNLIDVFLKTADESLKTLEDNATDGVNQSWIHAAHKLKGSSSFMGAEKLRSLCGEAQNMAAANSNRKTKILDQIKQQYAAVEKILKEQ